MPVLLVLCSTAVDVVRIVVSVRLWLTNQSKTKYIVMQERDLYARVGQMGKSLWFRLGPFGLTTVVVVLGNKCTPTTRFWKDKVTSVGMRPVSADPCFLALLSDELSVSRNQECLEIRAFVCRIVEAPSQRTTLLIDFYSRVFGRGGGGLLTEDAEGGARGATSDVIVDEPTGVLGHKILVSYRILSKNSLSEVYVLFICLFGRGCCKGVFGVVKGWGPTLRRVCCKGRTERRVL